jgi:Putative amidoligase enzyme
MSSIDHITFGVEIETTIPATAYISIGGYHNGLPVTEALHNGRRLVAPQFNGAAWRAERDGSIQVRLPGHTPCEFVSPVLKGQAGVRHLLEFVDFLTAIGAHVNPSCGLHVHVGLSSALSIEARISPDADAGNAVAPAPAPIQPSAAAKFVRILSRLVTRNATALYAQTGSISRETGSFCKKADEAVRKQISKACRAKNAVRLDYVVPTSDRYQLLNLTNLPTKRTVEFRCFAGTLNAAKILCHLLSVFLLVKVAANRKSLTNWDPAEQLSGVDALTNLLKSRPTFKIIDAAVFEENRVALLRAGFEMAAKYDQAKAEAAAAAAARPLSVDALAERAAAEAALNASYRANS